MGKRCCFCWLIMWAFCAATCAAEPHLDLEVATERGVQITAPQEWLQLLTSIGIDGVTIRGVRPGETPAITNTGSASRPSYQVLGILTARGQLRLPGGSFTRRDRAKLEDYFAGIAADGPESATAARGRFGITEKEFKAALVDLAQPIEFETKGQSAASIVARIGPQFTSKLEIGPDAQRALRDAAAFEDELAGVSAGTGLAMVLRSAGLAMRPDKRRGEPVVYRVEATRRHASGASTRGRLDEDAADPIVHWPVGWESEEAPGKLAPPLSESLNAEIAGYTMSEALDAVRPRVKIPILFDRAVLSAYKIEPNTLQVRLPRTKTSYRRLIDRIVAAARLGTDLRVDEAGRPFLWITR